jgi:hypothetical protein
MGMRGGLPKRQQQFNIQQPQQNQWTDRLNNLEKQTAELAKQPATTSSSQTTTNPYITAATTGAPNPWTYNAETGAYTPNSAAYTPAWMAPPPAAATPAPTIKQRQVKDFTKRGEGETGTLKQAYDLLQQEGAKRGKAIPDLAKYGAQMGPGGMVSGKLYNQVMEDIFGEDVDVADPNWKAPITPAPGQGGQAPANPWMPPNPNLGLGGVPGPIQGMGGMMGNYASQLPYIPPRPMPEDDWVNRSKAAVITPEEEANRTKVDDIYNQMRNITGGVRVRPEPTYWK